MIRDRDRRYLTYRRESIELIERRTSTRGYDSLERDANLRDAVLWRLETLAEVTGRLSDEIKQRHPQIRWRAIYGFRNIVAHGYMELRLELIWEIITVHLSDLRAVIDEELGRHDDADRHG